MRKKFGYMRWYNYLGLMFVGMFTLFFVGGSFVGMGETPAIMPIFVILTGTVGVILLNKT
jgi:hypothetical protein